MIYKRYMFISKIVSQLISWQLLPIFVHIYKSDICAIGRWPGFPYICYNTSGHHPSVVSTQNPVNKINISSVGMISVIFVIHITKSECPILIRKSLITSLSQPAHLNGTGGKEMLNHFCIQNTLLLFKIGNMGVRQWLLLAALLLCVSWHFPTVGTRAPKRAFCRINITEP